MQLHVMFLCLHISNAISLLDAVISSLLDIVMNIEMIMVLIGLCW